MLACEVALGQETPVPPTVIQEASTKTDEVERPLPDIPALMRSVEANQKAAEAIEKDYLYRSVQTEVESDGHGGVKKTESKRSRNPPWPGISVSGFSASIWRRAAAQSGA